MKVVSLTFAFLLMVFSVFGQTKMVIHKTNGQKDTVATAEINKITFFVAEIETTITDIDGNIYHVVQIGNQLWTVENLRSTKYNDGTEIPNVTINATWAELTTGAYCAYNNDENNVETYGYLYNWYAVDTGKLAPTTGAWRVPSDEDWTTLEKYLGMTEESANGVGWRGTDEGGKLKEAGLIHWRSPNSGATNSSGFSALPGGCRGDIPGAFSSLGYGGYWWSSSAGDTDIAWHRFLGYSDTRVVRYDYDRRAGFSVRLVQDL